MKAQFVKHDQDIILAINLEALNYDGDLSEIKSIGSCAIRMLGLGAGLIELNKSGDVATAISDNYYLSISSSGFIVKSKSSRLIPIIFEFGDLEDSENILANFKLKDVVRIVLSDRLPKEFNKYSEYKNYIAKSGTGISLRIASLPYFPDSRRIKFAGVSGEIYDSAPINSRVIVDQNFLIDLDTILRYKESKRNYDPEEVRDVVNWVVHCELIPGFAFAEISNSNSPERSKELQAVWDSWMDLNCERVDDFSRIKKFEKSNSIIDVEVLNNEYINTIALNYLSLLNVIEVWEEGKGKRFNNRQAIDGYERWVNSMSFDGSGLSAYIHAAISRLLLSRDAEVRNQVSEMFKINKKYPYSIQDLRGAAFDISLFGKALMFESGQVEGEDSRKTVIMSADIQLVANSIWNESAPLVIRNDQNDIPSIFTSLPFLDKYSKKDRQRIGEIQERAGVESISRVIRNKYYDPRAVWGLAMELEDRLVDQGIIRRD